MRELGDGEGVRVKILHGFRLPRHHRCCVRVNFQSGYDSESQRRRYRKLAETQDSIYLELQSAVPFGTGGSSFGGGIDLGDNFALFGSDLNLPDTYVSGTSFNAMLTFTGETFATLGVDEAGGPYVWTLMFSGDTITMRLPQFEAEAAEAAPRLSLKNKIKKLQKKAKAKKLQKKIKKLKKQLTALG